MKKIDPNEFKTILNSDFSKFYQKNIVISPIYFSKNQDESCNPSFFILIETGFYIQYYIHDWLQTEYITSPEYCNSPYTDLYLIEGGRCNTDILPSKVIEKIMEEGLYLCNGFDEIPEIIQKNYSNFYKKEFSSEPTYNLTFDMFNWLSIIKKRYEKELDIIFDKKRILTEYDKLNGKLRNDNESHEKVSKI